MTGLDDGGGGADPRAAGSTGGRAVVYVRISDDPSGSERGGDRQEADCRELAGKLGLAVAGVFKENDTSAFKQKTITLPSGERVRRVVRPRFREMLALLASGGADVMIAYDLDRAVRDPRDLEDLIDARTLAGFKVCSVTGSLRLDNDSDVAMARVLVAMANKSSADTARRVARAARQAAVEGRWHGSGAPFGYRLVDHRLRVVPEQAALVVEAAGRLVGGESLYAVTRDWNGRGVRTSKGGLWTEKAAKLLLRNPALKGVRSYRPVQPDGSRAPVPVVAVKGDWEPVLGEAEWAAVNAVLDERKARRTTYCGPVKRVHPFSGLIRCARCGEAMRKKGAVYSCAQLARGVCSRSINAAEVARVVEDAVLSVFSRIAAGPEPGGGGPGSGPGEAEALRVLIEKDRRALAELDDDHYDGLIDKPTWARQRSRLSDRAAARQREWQRLAVPATLAAGIDAATVADQWAGRPPGWRHAAAAAVLDAVLIHAHPAGSAPIIPKLRGEAPESYRVRLRAHREAMLAQRVELVWRA
ncbi:MAG: recombinase family protein [Bifidobacteriaceae bacterium]|jgi:DNA invertase Pin-like site-specific DNA recombinase|nr:recombinase family protein [Bifidobacteriaceae bacterium]